jgi:hypothetical protein
MRPFAAALSWLLLIVSAPVAHAHASLSHASPSADSALSTAPQEVTLTFTDTLEAAFSNLTVTDARGPRFKTAQLALALLPLFFAHLPPSAWPVQPSHAIAALLPGICFSKPG